MAHSRLLAWRLAVASAHGPPNPTTRFVLLALSIHMDEEGGHCWPSIARLQAMTGLGKQTVITHLAEADRLGWIARSSAGRSGQGWKRSSYQATTPDALNELQHDPENAVHEDDHVPPKVVKDLDHVTGDAVHEDDHVKGEGGPPGNRNVVHQVDPISSVISSKAADAVTTFCRVVGVPWKLSTPIPAWIDQLGAEPRFARIDLPYEIRKAADWWQQQRKPPKSPDRAIRSWLEKAKPAPAATGSNPLMMSQAELRRWAE